MDGPKEETEDQLLKLILEAARAWSVSPDLGAVYKVRHACGEGFQEGVTVCDRGGGPRACDVTL